MERRILAVEDDPGIRQFIRYTLEQAGNWVIEAETGAEAIAAARKTLPDLILMDVRMRGMDGLTACRFLKHDPLTCRIPIIIVSARSQMKEKEAGLEAGASAYLVKPFEPEELIQLTEQVLKFAGREAGVEL